MQKGFAHIFALIGVLIVVLVVGEVYFLSQTGSKSSQVSQNIPASSQNEEKKTEPKENGLLQIPKTIMAEQPKFNNHTDKNLGIEFDYGKELVVKIDSEEEYNKRGNGNFRKNFKGYVGYEPGAILGAVVVLGKDQNFDTNPFAVWVFENPGGLTVDGWFGKYWYYPFLWGVFDYTSKSHVTPDTEATISGTLAKSKIVAYQPGKPKFVYLSKDQKIYLLRVIGKVGEQILSSFKFLK